jgi:hypothetical protein
MSAVAAWASPFKQFVLLATGWDELDYTFNRIIGAIALAIILAGVVANSVMFWPLVSIIAWALIVLGVFRMQIGVTKRYLTAIGEPHDFDHAAAKAREDMSIVIPCALGFMYAYCAFLVVASIYFIIERLT